jgi:hypothetical protein
MFREISPFGASSFAKAALSHETCIFFDVLKKIHAVREWQDLVKLASYEFCRHWTCRQSATQNLLIQKPDADIYKCLIMIDFSIYNIESNQLTTTA